jgi:hypothetical protein
MNTIRKAPLIGAANEANCLKAHHFPNTNLKDFTSAPSA